MHHKLDLLLVLIVLVATVDLVNAMLVKAVALALTETGLLVVLAVMMLTRPKRLYPAAVAVDMPSGGADVAVIVVVPECAVAPAALHAAYA